MDNSLIKFMQEDWNLVKQRFVWLSELGKKIGLREEKESNLWYLVDLINANINENENGEDWYLEKRCLSLFGARLIEKLQKMISDLERKNVSVSDLRNDVEIKKIIKDLSAELLLISAAIGIAAQREFDPKETISFFEGETGVEKIKVIRTIQDCLHGEKEAHDILRSAMDYLGRDTGEQEDDVVLDDILIKILILDMMFRRFGSLTEGRQKFIFSDYFYRSIVLGIPVRRRLQEFFKDINGVIRYIGMNKMLAEAIERNEEVVMIADGAKKPWRDLLADYTVQVKDDMLSQKKQEEFVKKIYQEKEEDRRYGNWLKEALDIYVRLKQTRLIEWMEERNLTKSELYEMDLLQLFISFGMNGEFSFILDYYNGEQTPLVPLKMFVNELKERIDLKDEKNMQIVINFAEVLHKHNLLDKNKELIVYFQQDSTFHWNEEVFK